MIELFHVRKEYPGDGAALVDVTLEIGKGEFVFLTGPSGAGKSTLLRVVFCAEPPSSGQVLLFGKNVAKVGASAIPRVRRNIGFVFQDFKLLPFRTVAENVALPLEVMDLLNAANARGTTVVVATHDRSLLERYKKRVVVLERGRLLSDGDSIRRAATP